MGVQGLLSYLEDISKPVSLKNFAGQTIGVDGYGWLHRGAVSCAIELAQGKPTNRYVDFFMGRVRMLEHFGIKPYIVLDGDYLPSKAGTELQRSSSRESSKKIGLELLKVGRSAQAFQTLQKAVEVTPEMARLVIDELRRCGVSYVVAPYEADSQLVYLEKKGLISAILSEDSDMLVFGAKVLLTKLDKFGGTIMIRREKFTACRRLSFAGWTDNEFRRMCILSGCDYLANMKNMGLKNAHAMVRKHKSIDRIIRAIQFDGKFKVPPGYLKLFDQAEKTFLYQRVFDPKTKQLVTLNDPTPDFADEMEGLLYIGPKIDNETAAGIALGELHPHNKGELKPAPAPVKPLQRFNTPKLRTDSGPPGGDPPITDFFAKKRIPLAELDPNTFAPTPEQEALLARARNSEWNGYEAPVISSNSLRTRSAPIVVHPSQENIDPNVSSRRTASAPLSIARNSRGLRAGQPLAEISNSAAKSDRDPNAAHTTARSTISGPASKRQRLCSNSIDGAAGPSPRTSTGTKNEGRSKFFAPKYDDPQITSKIGEDHTTQDECAAPNNQSANVSVSFTENIEGENLGIRSKKFSAAKSRKSSMKIYLDDLKYHPVAEGGTMAMKSGQTPADDGAMKRGRSGSINAEKKTIAFTPQAKPKSNLYGVRRSVRDSGIGFSPIHNTPKASGSSKVFSRGMNSGTSSAIKSPTTSRKHCRAGSEINGATWDEVGPRVVVLRSDDNIQHVEYRPIGLSAKNAVMKSSPPRVNQGSEDSLLVHDSQSECGMSSDTEGLCAASPSRHAKVRVVDFQAFRFSSSHAA